MSEEQPETLKQHALRLIKEIQECPESMGAHCIQVLCEELEPLIEIADITSPADLTPEAPEIDLEWALRELADGWITNNEREGPYGFYQNARRVLTAIANDGADRQREADAQIVNDARSEGGADLRELVARIRNAK